MSDPPANEAPPSVGAQAAPDVPLKVVTIEGLIASLNSLGRLHQGVYLRIVDELTAAAGVSVGDRVMTPEGPFWVTQIYGHTYRDPDTKLVSRAALIVAGYKHRNSDGLITAEWDQTCRVVKKAKRA